MGVSLGDLHFTLGVDESQLDAQLAKAKTKITAALVDPSITKANLALALKSAGVDARRALETQRLAKANLDNAKATDIVSRSQMALNEANERAEILQNKKRTNSALDVNRIETSNAKNVADQAAFTNKLINDQIRAEQKLAAIKEGLAIKERATQSASNDRAITELQRRAAIQQAIVDRSAVSLARQNAINNASNNRDLTTAANIVNRATLNASRNTAINTASANRATIQEQQHATALQRTAAATSAAALAQQRLTNYTNTATRSFASQHQMVSRLAASMGIMFSVAGAVAFVKQLAIVSGEFELQRVALRAIIRDVEAADKIFSQVKTLAVKSPFSFSELLRDTKQLAAFSVETDKLFGTMTRLADVSAGLGVDMNRIILAYGQVKSATVLRGQELRQFTEAGIPIIDMLAQKFTKLEGTVVSAGDVFEKISNRMVSFKMVDEIFTDLTSSGGMFFEMQKKQSETLIGKISNLKDAYQIMLNSMGENNDSTLKTGVDFLTSMMANWEKIAEVLKIIVISYGAYKTATMLWVTWGRIANAVEAERVLIVAAAVRGQIALNTSQITAMATTRALTGAVAGLNTAFKINPVIAVVTAIAALGTVFISARKEANKLKDSLTKIFDEGDKTAKATIINMEILKGKLKDTNMYSADRAKIIADLNGSYGKYLDNVITEGDSYEKIATSLDKATSAIYENAKAKIYKQSIEQISEQRANTNVYISKDISKILGEAGFSKEATSSIVNDFFTAIEKDPTIAKRSGEAYSILTEQMAKAATKAGMGNPFKNLGMGDIAGLASDAEGFAAALSEANKKIDETNSTLESFGGQKTPLENELKSIAEKYKNLGIAINAAAREDDSFAEKAKIKSELLKNEQAQLLATAAAYDKYGLKSQAATAKQKAYDIDPLHNFAGQLSASILAMKQFNQADKEMASNIEANKSRKDIISDFTSQLEGYEGELARLKALSPDLQSQLPKGEIEKYKQLVALYTEIVRVKLGVKKKETGGEGTTKDPIAEQLKDQIALIKEAQKAFDEYRKVMGTDKALATAQKQYPTVKISTTDSGVGELTAMYNKLKVMSSSSAKEATISVKKDIEGLKKDGIIDSFDQLLKDAQEYIDQNKEKFDLAKMVEDITGDKKLAMKISFGVDFEGADVRDLLRKQISTLTKDLDVRLPQNLMGKSFDDFFPKDSLKNFGEEEIKLLKSSFDTLKSYDQSNYTESLSRMTKLKDEYGSSEEKKVAIHKSFAKQLDDVNKDSSIKSEEERNIMLSNIKNAEASAIAEVDATILASTQLYKDLYSDMEYYTVAKMKSIVAATEDMLKQTEGQKAVDNKFSVVVDGKDVQLTQEQIEKLRKQVEKIKATIIKDDPFLKIAAGMKLIGKGGEDAKAGLNMIASGVSEVAGLVSPLSDALDELGKSTENNGMQNFASDLSTAVEWMKTFANLAAGIATGNPAQIAGSLIDITTKLIKAEAEYQESKKKFLMDNIKMQYEYNNSLMAEQLAFASGTTIFGTDEIGRVTNAMGTYRDAINQAKIGVDELGDAEVITGTKRKKGWFLGALGGLITTGTKNVYGGLLATYKDLIKADGTLDINRAKALLATDKLTESTRQQLEQLVKLDETAKEAYAQMTEYLTNVFGSLGQSLSDSIVQAFRDGKDASLDFKDSVTTTVEKLTQDLMNSLFLADYFKKFQDKMTQVYADPNVTQQQIGNETIALMSEFYKGLGGIMTQSSDFLATMQDEGKKYGFDLFASTAEANQGLQGEIKGVTEDTAQLLASLLNAVRGDVSLQNISLKSIEGILSNTGSVTANSLAQLVKIESNTYNMMSDFKAVMGGKGSVGTGLRVIIQ